MAACTPGERLGHFRILERIGGGGMGEVYRARDEHLERDVAIKTISGLLANEAARRRFRREALALSRLNHPNIATVHDFATHGETDILVMELVGGEPLSERLARDGPMPEQQVIKLALQLVEALGTAHASGVVHRDLKPGNIHVLPDGRLKVLDFGLAVLRETADGGDATRTVSQQGALVGTLPYMAPEQVRGEPVDGRTDLYAVGVTLYQMVTGQQPFHDTNPLRLADAIAASPCPTPSRLSPAISPQLEYIIVKCLEKDPALRYQSARDLMADLQRLVKPGSTAVRAAIAPSPAGPRRRPWRGAVAVAASVIVGGLLLGYFTGWLRPTGGPGGSPVPQIRSLAVLPLANLSGDAAQEYFADGMTDTLTTDLAKIIRARRRLTQAAPSWPRRWAGVPRSCGNSRARWS